MFLPHCSWAHLPLILPYNPSGRLVFSFSIALLLFFPLLSCPKIIKNYPQATATMAPSSETATASTSVAAGYPNITPPDVSSEDMVDQGAFFCHDQGRRMWTPAVSCRKLLADFFLYYALSILLFALFAPYSSLCIRLCGPTSPRLPLREQTHT